jgi:bifunctional ADP-heptose synthase (sugar kinase/adenylyltransferase)
LDFEGRCPEGVTVNTRSKIVAVEALAQRLKAAAPAGAKIVVAFGRFDLISREMVEQLEFARAGNVVLIAAVDEQSAPDELLPADARAKLAAGLAAVSLVAVADPKKLREALPTFESIEVKSDLAPRLLARFRGTARA